MCRANLSATVQAQLEAARAGGELLRSAERGVGALRDKLDAMDRCAGLGAGLFMACMLCWHD